MKKLFLLLLAGCLSPVWAAAQPVIEKQGSKKEPFTFVQIADPQLGFCAKGQDWHWTIDNLKATVARVNALKPAFVIVTGDLIHNWKNDEQAEAYREQIGRIDASIPVFHLPGNHDMPKYAAEAVAKYRDAFGYDRFAFAYNGSAFIGLNSNPMVCDGERAAADARAQLEWFGQQLERYRKCNHIFVFSHHPLTMSPDSRVTHKSSYDEPFRSEYAALMKKYGVRAVFAGHTHIAGLTEVAGIPMLIAGASSHPLYGASTGINVVEVTPTDFSSEFVVNDPADGNIRLR